MMLNKKIFFIAAIFALSASCSAMNRESLAKKFVRLAHAISTSSTFPCSVTQGPAKELAIEHVRTLFNEIFPEAQYEFVKFHGFMESALSDHREASYGDSRYRNFPACRPAQRLTSYTVIKTVATQKVYDHLIENIKPNEEEANALANCMKQAYARATKRENLELNGELSSYNFKTKVMHTRAEIERDEAAELTTLFNQYMVTSFTTDAICAYQEMMHNEYENEERERSLILQQEATAGISPVLDGSFTWAVATTETSGERPPTQGAAFSSANTPHARSSACASARNLFTDTPNC